MSGASLLLSSSCFWDTSPKLSECGVYCVDHLGARLGDDVKSKSADVDVGAGGIERAGMDPYSRGRERVRGIGQSRTLRIKTSSSQNDQQQKDELHKHKHDIRY